MADALCGPSNALQSFQKHSQVDRTLQQDRLVGPRQGPSQGFRSFDPRAGSLDADFHAFENASSTPFHLEHPSAQWMNHAPPSLQTPMSTGMPSWASDFQNMRISSSPVPVSQFRTEAPMIKSVSGGWQEEFINARPFVSERAAGKQPMTSALPAAQAQSLYSGLMPQSLVTPQFHMHQQGHDLAQQEHTQQYSDAAFEQAFQDAFKEMQNLEQQGGHDTMAQHGVVEDANTLQDRNIDPEALIQEVSHSRIGADTIPYTEQKDRTPDMDQRDANELARLAGELVQHVSHETDDKFLNSQFLDLMRRIRDREVEVRDNNFEHIQHVQEPSTSIQQSTGAPEQLKEHDLNTFEFPDMDNVYKPNGTIDMSPDFYSFPSEYEPAQARTQIQDLHPGGPRYPEASGAILQSSGETNSYAAA